MGAAVQLRRDFDGKALRRLARASRDADQTRRLRALAAVYDGASRRAAAEIGDLPPVTLMNRVDDTGPPT